jgi:exopolyphosphatase/guanosine-5'-triphosphate,3'-diphosphate pyrophosphatase
VIVPRWEWRTFGQRFGEADTRFGALVPERAEESDEIYLLSAGSDASVKVREGLMDVKELQAVNEDGLEQWKPVLKAAFPLPASDVARVTQALAVTVPALARAEYGLEDLIEEVVEPTEELIAVEVHKRREHHTIDGCMAELSEVETEQGSRRTIALESEDPARVIAAVRELGLETRRNVCVARGLKAIVGLGAKRYAVVDVGTNSVKFVAGELRADGKWRTIVDRAEVTRLGEGLDESGRLGEEPVARTVEAIAGMADEARRNGVEAIAAVGTAGLRMAPNRAALIDAVRERTGAEVEVISGDEEARLAYVAVMSGLELGGGSVVVFETGGGSSQFTFGRGAQVEDRFSLDVGAARFTERFGLDGAVSDDTLSSAMEAIAGDLAPLDGRPSPDVLVGMGGAVTNLAAVKHELAEYDPSVVQGTVLELGEIDRQIELYRTRAADERREIVGLQPGRAAVILAGACIVRAVTSKLGNDRLTASDRGLRHGLLVERFGKHPIMGG